MDEEKHPRRKRDNVGNKTLNNKQTQQQELDSLYDDYKNDEVFDNLRGDDIGFVRGFGPFNPAIMIVGEAPGHLENEKGIPFIGRSGKYLSDFLKEAKILPKDVFMTNMVKYWPQDPIHPYKTREFTKEEIEESKQYLLDEIEIVNPGVVGLCGYAVIEAFIPDFGHIYNVNGDLIDGKYVPLYHPTVVTNNPVKREDMRVGYRMLKAISQVIRKVDERKP